ncbi:hypothetical protein GGS23DRAFT_602470 [Durotheca rogersii]|uniref:uncharacterized protein n=1 Tax=Durotheca rogersii TaxID=419775 RepID=UPI00221F9BC7|nr:uncharacterized protein GGS23DRAFT_602470 [Durotheca rogersii]KAI5867321.1 hypothetical protein GGS23DRAFT_602470 [Durotheca rogersii]
MNGGYTSGCWFQVPPVAQVTLTRTLPPGVTGKDVILALCPLFPADFVGSEEAMARLSIDDQLTISNMSTEWSATSAMFPIDKTLERWLRNKATEAATYEGRTTPERLTHDKIDQLYADPTHIQADPGAHYAKKLHLNLSTLLPQVTGPNSVKISTPLSELVPKNIKVDEAYIVSGTNSRSSGLKAATKVFQNAAKASGSREIPEIADHVQLYIAAASINEQKIAEKEAYLASPEVVAASALSGEISGAGVYKTSENLNGIEFGYGTGSPASPLIELESAVEQLDSLIDRAESSVLQDDDAAKETTWILLGFPKKIREVCMVHYDPDFGSVAKPNDILQAATAILARQIPLVVAGSFSSIFARNSINNALLAIEKVLTRRTGWTGTWDISRSTIKVQEGEDGECWEEKVGHIPRESTRDYREGGLDRMGQA